ILVLLCHPYMRQESNVIETDRFMANSSAYLLGYDVGSSSIKASLLEAETGKLIGSATSPKTEMAIQAPHEGWAEQDPEAWWQHVINATSELKQKYPEAMKQVAA